MGPPHLPPPQTFLQFWPLLEELEAGLHQPVHAAIHRDQNRTAVQYLRQIKYFVSQSLIFARRNYPDVTQLKLARSNNSLLSLKRYIKQIFTSENTNGGDASDATAVWRRMFSNFCIASFITLTRRLCHKKAT